MKGDVPPHAVRAVTITLSCSISLASTAWREPAALSGVFAAAIVIAESEFLSVCASVKSGA